MDMKTLHSDVDLSKMQDVDETLKRLAKEEVKISMCLEDLLSKQCEMEPKLCGIGKEISALCFVNNYSKKLNEQINNTAHLAVSVSAKVRRLDLTRSRASECQQRVHDLIDLQLCSISVVHAIDEAEYEKAAGHIARFLAMDQNLLQKTADDVQGTVTSVSDAVRTLENASRKLREVIYERFDEAVKNDDLSSVERFFKIFPLFGCHEEGIKRFSDYICSKLSSKAQKDLKNFRDMAIAKKRPNVAYADALSILLEDFARVIEVNQPIIESCYGQSAGYLLDMICILHRECDIEVKNLLIEFNKDRTIQRRIHQINSNQRSFSANNIGSSAKQVSGPYSKSSNGSMEKLNSKDIDGIISEITVMHSRMELYFRFIKRHVKAHLEHINLSKEKKQEKVEKLELTLGTSELSRLMQDLLSTYLLFERYFMEESVLKAIALDTYDSGQQCSSMVDDVFFILRKCIRRSLTTQSVNGTCAVINNAASCLESDFINALKSPLKNGYPLGCIDLAQAYNAIQNTLQQGKLQSNDSDKNRINFLISLNNADMSIEYIETLWQMMEQEIEINFPSMPIVKRQLINSCLAELKTVRDAFEACIDLGMQHLRSSVIKPRLHPWVDQFLNYKHILAEEELIAYEAGDTFIQYLIVQIDGLLRSFINLLKSRNYDALVSILATEVTIRLERAIKKSAFNRLGGLILDREVRALCSYLTAATSWSVRDKMTRLSQIATLLNLENVAEITDYWNPSNSEIHTWRLTPNEVRTILTLRSDFKIEDIKRIQL